MEPLRGVAVAGVAAAVRVGVGCFGEVGVRVAVAAAGVRVAVASFGGVGVRVGVGVFVAVAPPAGGLPGGGVAVGVGVSPPAMVGVAVAVSGAVVAAGSGVGVGVGGGSDSFRAAASANTPPGGAEPLNSTWKSALSALAEATPETEMDVNVPVIVRVSLY